MPPPSFRLRARWRAVTSHGQDGAVARCRVAVKKRTNRAPKKTTAPDWSPRFLARLAETGNILAACRAVGISRSTVYDRRDGDQAFAALMASALEDAIDDLEEEARQRARDGSDVLLMFLLKAHRPEKYRERHEVKHQGEIRHTVRAEDMTDDELARIASSGS